MNQKYNELAQFAGELPQAGRDAAAPLKFSKDDLVFIATTGPTLVIRRSAAEALYQHGRSDGAKEIAAVYS